MQIRYTVTGYKITYGCQSQVRDGFYERVKGLVCIAQFQ